MKKIKVDKIIGVSELPGLYKVISHGTKGVIIEHVIDKKRTIVLNHSKIYALDKIGIYVTDGERPIAEALYQLYDYLKGQPAPHHKNTPDQEIKALFEKAIPDYDKEKVSIFNMRKLIQWYNILHTAQLLEIEQPESTDTTDNTYDNTQQENSATVPTEAEVVNNASEHTTKKRGRKKKTDNDKG